MGKWKEIWGDKNRVFKERISGGFRVWKCLEFRKEEKCIYFLEGSRILFSDFALIFTFEWPLCIPTCV